VVRRDKQANGFECNRLPSRVRSSDEEYALAVAQFKVNRNDSTKQEGMTCTEKREVVIGSRCCEVPISLCRNISCCAGKIYVGKERTRYAQWCSLSAYKRAQGGENPRLLPLYCSLSLTRSVPKFNDLKRLDPNRLTRRTRIVDDPRNL
jgi:hypothetical protein